MVTISCILVTLMFDVGVILWEKIVSTIKNAEKNEGSIQPS